MVGEEEEEEEEEAERLLAGLWPMAGDKAVVVSISARNDDDKNPKLAATDKV